jgi:hypothetical protein
MDSMVNNQFQNLISNSEVKNNECEKLFTINVLTDDRVNNPFTKSYLLETPKSSRSISASRSRSISNSRSRSRSPK